MAESAAPQGVARKLISSHLVDGEMTPGEEMSIRIDQTLTQDATGTLVMQELEALGLERVHTELSVQYVDHNLLQTDEKNAEDHAYLHSACRQLRALVLQARQRRLAPDAHAALREAGEDDDRVGLPHPGLRLAGHARHRRRRPGGRAGDHRPAAARSSMPEIWGDAAHGELPPWCSAKDVILEMLRRHGTKGATNRIIEYHGPGLDGLTAMDRHVIANMGAELGATTTVFPADDAVRAFLDRRGPRGRLHRAPRRRGRHRVRRSPSDIDLSEIVPLIAKPSSPGNVVPVSEVVGRARRPGGHRLVGEPGPARLRHRRPHGRGAPDHDAVSFDVNPSSREILADLTHMGRHAPSSSGRRPHPPGRVHGLHRHGAGAGPRHQLVAHVPAQLPRPLRRGRRRPGVAVLARDGGGQRADGRDHRPARARRGAGARVGRPRAAGARDGEHARCWRSRRRPAEAGEVELVKGPNISGLPEFDRFPDALEVPILLKVGDDISTDDISPAGAAALPYRSNIPKLAQFAFVRIDEDYPRRRRRSRSPAATRSSGATTTARARRGSTRPSARATWGCGW